MYCFNFLNSLFFTPLNHFPLFLVQLSSCIQISSLTNSWQLTINHKGKKMSKFHLQVKSLLPLSSLTIFFPYHFWHSFFFFFVYFFVSFSLQPSFLCVYQQLSVEREKGSPEWTKYGNVWRYFWQGDRQYWYLLLSSGQRPFYKERTGQLPQQRSIHPKCQSC